eukprot:1009012-Rhodomonas_salina.1
MRPGDKSAQTRGSFKWGAGYPGTRGTSQFERGGTRVPGVRYMNVPRAKGLQAGRQLPSQFPPKICTRELS